MDSKFLSVFDEMVNGKSKTPVLFDPTQITGIDLVTRISRFNLPGVRKFEPYNLSYQTISALDNRIIFLPQDINLGNLTFTGASKFYYRRGNAERAHMFWAPAGIEDKLFKRGARGSSSDYKNFDITILGIFAIILRTYFDDFVFKAFVENNYLKPNFDYSPKHKLWILNEENRLKLNVDLDLIMRLIDLHENQGIEYLHHKIPHTYAWRQELE